MPPDQTCRSCFYHRAEDAVQPGHGECRGGLPDRAIPIGRTHTYVYKLTANDLAACAMYRPRSGGVAMPAIPGFETKEGGNGTNGHVLPAIEAKEPEPTIAVAATVPIQPPAPTAPDAAPSPVAAMDRPPRPVVFDPGASFPDRRPSRPPVPQRGNRR